MGFNHEQWISRGKLGGTMINGSFMDDYTYDKWWFHGCWMGCSDDLPTNLRFHNE